MKLRRQFDQNNNVADLYAYVGVIPAGEPMVLSLAGTAETVSVEAMDRADLGAVEVVSLAQRRVKTAPTDTDWNRIYSAQALDEGTYYVQYNACREDPNLPMETFAAQVRTALDAGDYGRIVVDLRSNGGGSDGVIWPLLAVLRAELDRGTEVVGLIGESTFSSAVINAVELQEMGGVLVGEPASGSVSHFGAVNGFTLPHSGVKVQHSTKWIDLNTLLDAGAGRGVVSLTPDVEIPQTMVDFLAGKDTCVEWLLSHQEPLKQTAWPQAPLTRGRLVGQLYQAAGAPPQTVAALPFPDMLMGIEWYTPALAWGKDQGIAKGGLNGGFSAARAVTWQELAVFLTRTATALDLAPKTVRTTPLPAALAANAWDQAALESAWSWGLLPETASSATVPTRTQGEGAVASLFKSV